MWPFFVIQYSILNIFQLIHVEYAARVQGPLFIEEPPVKVEFMNDRGAIINCVAHGEPDPNIEWLIGDDPSGIKVHDSGSLRRVYDNGSMILAPFRPDKYRQDVHGTVYRCKASNIHGSIVSWPVTVRAATSVTSAGQSSGQIQAQVYDVYVIRDNTAVLTCHVPPFLKEDLKVTSWVREDNFIIKRKSTKDGKYSIADDGKLYVSSVTRQDGGMNYWCRVRHKLSNQTVLSSTAGNIVVTEPHRNVPLKITNIMGSLEIPLGKDFVVLPCVAQGYPAPTYRWFVSEDGPRGGSRALTSYNQRDGMLILRKIKDYGMKNYTCMAENSNDRVNMTTSLIITEKIHVHVEPQHLVVDSGQRFRLNCTVTGYPIDKVTWLHNGNKVLIDEYRVSIIEGNGLFIKSAKATDQGMYQCFANNHKDSAQGTAQVRLGAIPPKLIKTFKSRVLQPGPSVELLCTATGYPLPSITWSRLGEDITISTKYQINNQRNNDKFNRLLNSRLTIRNIRPKDGGEYTCTATNRLSTSTFTERINVYGLPVVHPISNLSVATGSDVTVKCYVSGYPIKVIKWRRSGPRRRLPKNSDTTKNGTLILYNVRNEDGGEYKCTANNGRGQKASRVITVSIIKKPEIGTLSSPGKVEVGKLVTIVCTVRDGDEPIRINWMKDGGPLSVDLGIDFMEAKRFSYLQIREVKTEHNGNYTCTAKNSAGQSNKTVDLDVLVPPEWTSLPVNTSAVVGTSKIYLNCFARASPLPVIKWSRNEDEESLVNSSKYEIFSNGTLAVKNVQMSDGGEYSCDISNGVYPDLSGSITLKVGVAPKIVNQGMRKSVYGGENVTIQCSVEGTRPMTLSWNRDDRPLNNNTNNRYLMKNFQKVNGVMQSLMIIDSQMEDSGRYQCWSSNKFGRTFLRHTIVVYEPTTLSTTTIITTTTLSTKTREISLKTRTVMPLITTSTRSYVYIEHTLKPEKELLETGDVKNTIPIQKSPSQQPNETGNGMLNETIDSETFSYSIQDLLTNDSWLIFYVAPGVALIIILIAIIFTSIVFLATRKPRRSRKLASVISSPIRNSYDADSLRQKPVNTLNDSSYGKLEPSKLWSTGKRLENGYEIPDYCSGVKPYGTLQLGQFYGRRVPTATTKSSQEEKQQSL